MSKTPKLDTIADYLARDEEEHIELIRGAIVEKAEATGEHGMSQSGVTSTIHRAFHRKPGGSAPGGWWILTELEVQLGDELFRPDVCGYRRERMPQPPTGRPELVTPDWVCEVLSPSHPARDRVLKFQTYFRAGIPHYWIIDPVGGTLEVFRRTPDAYALVLTALREERVRAEPFDAIEVRVAELMGDDPED